MSVRGETVRVEPPAAPASGATATIWNSVNIFGAKMMRVYDVRRVEVNFLSISHASAASGFNAYASTNGGTNWDQVDFGSTMPATIAASTAGVDAIHNFKVDQYDDFKLEFTLSAATLTAWRISVMMVIGDVDKGS